MPPLAKKVLYYKSVLLKSRVPIRYDQWIFIYFKFFLLQSKRTTSIQLSVLELSKKNIHCTHLHDFYEFCRPGNPIPWYFQVFHAWGTLLGSDGCLDCYILPWMHFDSITFISYMMCITACCGTTWSGKLVFLSRVL